jgi:hypothetical protein
MPRLETIVKDFAWPTAKQHKIVASIKKLKKKIEENQLTVAKADKKSFVVALRTDEYVEKVETFLRDNGVIQYKFNVPKQNGLVKERIRQSKLVVLKYIKGRMEEMNPTVPLDCMV